jgi:lipopolysaccharide transport system ATP-binding protein
MPQPETIIRVENLSKRYVIRHNAKRADTFRDAVMSSARALGNRLRHPLGPRANGSQEEFWALKDVDFEVKRGDVVGIIGRNGAGKSTLLKILSRITEPSTGRITIDGRVASLLEVGTGFHSELSGRENIYLNGAILGMARREITKKFDQIVAFAEVEKFIDTPVKHYSTGMYMRLAFAVAAHLEPEILVVDEVLAVGDSAFQKKSLGKMHDVAEDGRTVLFVSHNMQAMTTLCDRAILLRHGQLVHQGSAPEVVRFYLDSRVDQNAEMSWTDETAPGDTTARLKAVRVLDEQEHVEFDHAISKPIAVEMEVDVLKSGYRIDTSIHVLNEDGLCLFAVGATLNPEGNCFASPGRYRSICRIPAHFLNDGKHYVSAFVVRDANQINIQVHETVAFMAHDYGTDRGGYVGKIIGAVRPLLAWDVHCVGKAS